MSIRNVYRFSGPKNNGPQIMIVQFLRTVPNRRSSIPRIGTSHSHSLSSISCNRLLPNLSISTLKLNQIEFQTFRTVSSDSVNVIHVEGSTSPQLISDQILMYFFWIGVWINLHLYHMSG